MNKPITHTSKVELANDTQLEEILSQWEFEFSGIPKHWEKTEERVSIDNRLKAALLAWRQEAIDSAESNGCPCLLIEPCSYACSCASSTMSGGCMRCCNYGSVEQRLSAARRLAGVTDLPTERSSQDNGLTEAQRKAIDTSLRGLLEKLPEKFTLHEEDKGKPLYWERHGFNEALSVIEAAIKKNGGE